MNITGAHVIVYSKDADADRAFLRDVLKFPHVDAGHGWLIFALPPGEVATHPGERNDTHELYLMTDDVHEFIAAMEERGIVTTPIQEERWGSITKITLPGGGALGVYQANHPSPAWKSSAKKSATTGAKKSAKQAKAAKRSAKGAKKTAKKSSKSR